MCCVLLIKTGKMEDNQDKETSTDRVKENTEKNSWCGRDFSHPSIPVLGLTQTSMQCVPGLFPGRKAAGAWR